MDSSGKDWRQAGAPILPISSALKRRQKKKKLLLTERVQYCLFKRYNNEMKYLKASVSKTNSFI